MSTSTAIAIAITFVWWGMVTAISFVEAPLKFRAPNITLQIGLGIGRLVFRALNSIEAVFAVVILVLIAVTRPAMPMAAIDAYAVAIAMLVAQLAAVRPRLNKRSDQVLAGYEGPRSKIHYVYVGLEAVKLIALLVAGISLLAGVSC